MERKAVEWGVFAVGCACLGVGGASARGWCACGAGGGHGWSVDAGVQGRAKGRDPVARSGVGGWGTKKVLGSSFIRCIIGKELISDREILPHRPIGRRNDTTIYRCIADKTTI